MILQRDRDVPLTAVPDAAARRPRGSGRGVDRLLGPSEALGALRATIVRAARAPFPVLIEGESGTGKDLVARALHEEGPSRDRTFGAINCAALTDELVEAELFGHTRGAFTGAVAARAGLLETTSGGTVFLDEVGELSARAQAKLLRVLEDGEVRKLGDTAARRVDLRVVAATNRTLRVEAEADRFRADLRYRLDVIHLTVPPLRDRPDDLGVLVDHFWGLAAAEVGTTAGLGRAARRRLLGYSWPGNVRQLRNVLAAVAVAAPRHGVVDEALLPLVVRDPDTVVRPTLSEARAALDRRMVADALARAEGRRAVVARELGITRQGLSKLMTRLEL